MGKKPGRDVVKHVEEDKIPFAIFVGVLIPSANSTPRDALIPKMATFTKLPDGEKPLIEVDAAKKLSKVDDMTYGGFTEYARPFP